MSPTGTAEDSVLQLLEGCYHSNRCWRSMSRVITMMGMAPGHWKGTPSFTVVIVIGVDLHQFTIKPIHSNCCDCCRDIFLLHDWRWLMFLRYHLSHMTRSSICIVIDYCKCIWNGWQTVSKHHVTLCSGGCGKRSISSVLSVSWLWLTPA